MSTDYGTLAVLAARATVAWARLACVRASARRRAAARLCEEARRIREDRAAVSRCTRGRSPA
jgi:hypothetical protein